MLQKEKIIQLDTALDHLTGEEIGQALQALNDMPEVLDALYLTGIGKKNRPAGLMQALCRPADEEAVLLAIFRHTHSLGVRRQEIERIILPRQAGSARKDGNSLPAKIYSLEGESYVRPEADAIARLAAQKGIGAPGLRFGKL